jgi:hypothetical protein
MTYNPPLSLCGIDFGSGLNDELGDHLKKIPAFPVVIARTRAGTEATNRKRWAWLRPYSVTAALG